MVVGNKELTRCQDNKEIMDSGELKKRRDQTEVVNTGISSTWLKMSQQAQGQLQLPIKHMK